MRTLKESILSKTKDQVKNTAKCMDAIEREQKNLPKMSDFKIWQNRQWKLDWKCPNLIQLALDICGRCDNPLLNEPVGFTFHFNMDSDTIYPMTLNKRGMFFPIMGWDKIDGISGNDNHRKKVILEIIKKLSDIDKMAELFDHYNKFCFRKELDGKSLLNDL